jgi:small subunit ribosomal protein S20
MANHKSAAKRARQTPKRRERNRGVKNRARTAVKEFLGAVESGDVETARARFRTAERELRKAASAGTMNRRTVDRRVSRLALRLSRAGS